MFATRRRRPSRVSSFFFDLTARYPGLVSGRRPAGNSTLTGMGTEKIASKRVRKTAGISLTPRVPRHRTRSESDKIGFLSFILPFNLAGRQCNIHQARGL